MPVEPGFGGSFLIFRILEYFVSCFKQMAVSFLFFKTKFHLQFSTTSFKVV